jgi:hypothetical protein
LRFHQTLIAGAIGFVATAVVAASPAAARMQFTAIPLGNPAQCGQRCPVVIQAEGRITREAAEDFVAFARNAANTGQVLNIVLVHSPGGSVLGSLMLGTAFRSIGTTVVVARVNRGGGWFGGQTVDARTGQAIPVGSLTNAVCNSACVYAVMGGKNRVVPNDSRMGIHRMQAEAFHGYDPVSGRVVRDRRTGSVEQVQALKRYAKRMGVDPRIIDVAESIPHEEIKVLSAAEVRSFRLGVPKLSGQRGQR